MATHSKGTPKLLSEPDVRQVCWLCHGPIYTDEPVSYLCPDCDKLMLDLHEAHKVKGYDIPRTVRVVRNRW